VPPWLCSSDAARNFLLTSDLVTSIVSNVFVLTVVSGNNVGLYWTVASAATLKGPTFAGNVLARSIISSGGYDEGNVSLSPLCRRRCGAATRPDVSCCPPGPSMRQA